MRFQTSWKVTFECDENKRQKLYRDPPFPSKKKKKKKKALVGWLVGVNVFEWNRSATHHYGVLIPGAESSHAKEDTD